MTLRGTWASLAARLRRALAPGPAAERKPVATRASGERGESLAVSFLRRNGFRIRERNFRTPAGELDVIAEEADLLCFVEVKWRRGPVAGHPAAAVTPEKQRRIARAAEWYLARRRLHGRACRFDVVAIVGNEDDVPSATLYRDAFRGPFPPRRPS
ncbi:MAG TPA: YraN family protein [Thermoanaerobaculia bacterium]|nr:YraN family protein [Thermoanaerobaculia bacterium]